jgi:2'-5' RNA ligase/predicted GNAT family acetyltransferase
VARIRVGVVLPIPDPVATEIDGLRRALGDPALDRVAPHVTLLPPVNAAEADLPAALADLRAAASSTDPLTLDLGPVVTFWPVTPVLYVAVAGDLDVVRRLHERLVTGPIGRPPEWPFVPHITVGQDVDPALIPSAVSLLAGYRWQVTIDRVQLLTERPSRKWEVVEDVELGGTRTVGRGGLELEISTSEAADRGRGFVVTARREGVVVATASGRAADDLVLDWIEVTDDVRGQGIGSHVLAHVELLGARRGCRRAVAVCPADGLARAWLASRGWQADAGVVRMVRAL